MVQDVSYFPKRKRKLTKNRLQLLIMASLGVLFLLIFNYAPLYGITLAFTNGDYKLKIVDAVNANFVGLNNFLNFFNDDEFTKVLTNTLGLNGLMLLINFPETWASLLLDNRNPSAYPDICEDSKGNIYVIWDYGREVENEIRISRFTESDALAGVFYTENSKNKMCVSKNSDFIDIVSLNTKYDHTLIYEVGEKVTKEDIIATLPTTIEFVTDKGETYSISGTWKTGWFTSEKAGAYNFKFDYRSRELPDGVSDTLDLFNVVVLVLEPEEPSTVGIGCAASITAAFVTPLLLGAAVVIFKKKKWCLDHE